MTYWELRSAIHHTDNKNEFYHTPYKIGKDREEIRKRLILTDRSPVVISAKRVSIPINDTEKETSTSLVFRHLLRQFSLNLCVWFP